MRLERSMDMGLGPRAVRAPRRRPDARIISPLPNARLGRGAAVAAFVHHPVLEPMNGTGLTGSATLRLHGDKLQVCVTTDRQVHIDLRRCPVSGQADKAKGRRELVLVVTALGGIRLPVASSASFDLSLRDGFAILPEADFAQFTAFDLDALSHAAVPGLPTQGGPARRSDRLRNGASSRAEGMPAAARGAADHAYFLRRIKDEIDAALRANEPGVASRHVQIATLMVRRIQGRPPGDPWGAGNGLGS